MFRNISKDFSEVKMEKNGLIGCLHDYPVDWGSIVVEDILDIYKYLMKNNIKNNIK